MDYIVVKNISGRSIGITDRETKTHRQFRAGAQKTMSKEELTNLIFNEDGVETMFRKGYLKIVADREFYESINLEDIFDEPDYTPEDLFALSPDEFEEVYIQLAQGKKERMIDYALDKGFPYHVQSIVLKYSGKDLSKMKAIKDAPAKEDDGKMKKIGQE